MSLELALADLQAKVGTETHVSDWLTITQDRVNKFAEATGDFQWIHVNPERAEAESPYGTTIAHGYLTLSLIPYLGDNVNPDKPMYPDIKLAINYGLNRVRFPHPVAVGSQIRTRTEIAAVAEVKNNGVQIINKVTIEIQGASKPACVAETVVRLYF